MIRVYVFCEGQTEANFVSSVLAQPVFEYGVELIPLLFSTSTNFKGGISSYGKVKNQVTRMCKEHPQEYVTTLIDYYGLPTDFPERSLQHGWQGALVVEREFQDDVNHANFIANIVVHEFEGLLFSEPLAFERLFGESVLAEQVASVRDAFPTPEHINDSRETAPSKRISGLFSYDKASDGPLLAAEIGLERICHECKHFGAWVAKLKNLGGANP